MIRFSGPHAEAHAIADGDHVDRRAANSSIGSRLLQTIVFIALIAAVCGQFPPDVNESHYLTKAKHFWDSSWCSGDLFLESADAHWLFFATTGWVTRWISLEAYAMAGRAIVWALLAWYWAGISIVLFRSAWAGAVALGLFLLLNERFHLAGEWVIGGFEGKSICYACCFAAIYFRLDGRWNLVWLTLGAAIGFHALAGSWLAGAVLMVEIARHFLTGTSVGSIAPLVRENLRFKQIACLAVAGVLAATGWVPSLISQIAATPSELRDSAWIQVTQRLSHHQFFPAFETVRIVLFTSMLIFWAALFWRRRHGSSLEWFHQIAIVGIGLNFIGLVLSAIVEQQGAGADYACTLLRLYWFRFADFAVPLAVAVSVTSWLDHWITGTDPGMRPRLAIAVISVLAVATCLHVVSAWSDLRPPADATSLPDVGVEHRKRSELWVNWKEVCEWAAENTPSGSIFITPAQQQTFKWYSGRAEIVCWKDMPQDPRGIVEWARRIELVYRPQVDFDLGLLALSDEQLLELGTAVCADYVIVPQRDYDRVSETCRLRVAYPRDITTRVSFVVLKLGTE